MQRQFLYLTWADFDEAIADLTRKIRYFPVDRIYGVPRGGLTVAVALSHATGLPLTLEQHRYALWVDDIVDSGETLNRAKGGFSAYSCWVTRPNAPLWLFPSRVVPLEQWVVFPWENPKKAEEDLEQYLKSRKEPDRAGTLPH